VIAGLFIAFGVLAAVSFLWGLVTGHLQIDQALAVFMLPVGQGLHEGRKSSRRWAVAWLCYGVIAAMAILVSAVTNPADLHAQFFGLAAHGVAATPYAYSVLPALIAIYGLVLWQLFSPQVELYIRQSEAVRRLLNSNRDGSTVDLASR